MGSKLILLLGIILGVALTYFCIQDNKAKLTERYATVNLPQKESIAPQKKIPVTPQIQEEQAVPAAIKTSEKEAKTKKPQKVLKEPTFFYTTKDQETLHAHMSLSDKTLAIVDFLDTACTQQQCDKNITFTKDTAPAKWQEEVINIASYLHNQKIKDALISVKNHTLEVAGIFDSNISSNKFHKLLDKLNTTDMKINDLTKLQEIQSTKETNATQQKIEPSLSIEDIQRKINITLQKNPIYFQRNSDKLVGKSKKTLDKIITLVNKSNLKFSFTVEGHTDASGDAEYNKYLSQKRANTVQNYLLSHHLNIKTISALGMGEEKPITADPYKKENRRVEIHIRKGD